MLLPCIQHTQISLVLTLRPNPSTCVWISPHVVGALEKHLIERLWLLAADTDQAASTVGAVLQSEPVPLAPEHGRARSSGTLTHAGLHAGAGEEGKAAAAMAIAMARGGAVREGRHGRSTKENG